MPVSWLPDGFGTSFSFTEVPSAPYILPYLLLLRTFCRKYILPQFAICVFKSHILPQVHFATVCHMWFWCKHFATSTFCHVLPRELTMGNRGTSVTTPFLLTPSGICQASSLVWSSWLTLYCAQAQSKTFQSFSEYLRDFPSHWLKGMFCLKEQLWEGIALRAL